MFLTRLFKASATPFYAQAKTLNLLGETGLEQLLFLSAQLANRVDLLDTLRAEFNVGGKVLDTLRLVQGRLDESGLNDAGLAVQRSDKGVGESGTGYNRDQSLYTLYAYTSKRDIP